MTLSRSTSPASLGCCWSRQTTHRRCSSRDSFPSCCPARCSCKRRGSLAVR